MKIPIARIRMGSDELRAIRGVLSSGYLSSGPKTEEFEEKFSKKMHVDYSVAVCNGTAALDIALLALGINGKVVVPAFSFIATATCVTHTGNEPVFCDIEPRTFNIEVSDLSSKIKEHAVRAVVPVALFGQSYDIESVQTLKERAGIKVVQDLAQAHGSLFRGRSCAEFGDISCFSFYATKNITTLGEGGMITTNDQKLADKCRILINQGQSQKYIHPVIGYNYRMTEVQAAVGLVQLKKLDKINNARRKNAHYMINKLSSVDGFELPFEDKRCFHSFHMFTVRTTFNRDNVISYLRSKLIDARPVYPMPMYRQKAFKKFSNYYCKNAENVCKTCFHLPVHPYITKEQLKYMVEIIRKFKST